LHVPLVTLAGWVNRHQQHVIEYLIEEHRVLKGQLKGRRLRLTDDQRRRLPAKGLHLGRRVLRQVATIVTPDTILRTTRSSCSISEAAGARSIQDRQSMQKPRLESSVVALSITAGSHGSRWSRSA
jgi:hypothetical protein